MHTDVNVNKRRAWRPRDRCSALQGVERDPPPLLHLLGTTYYSKLTCVLVLYPHSKSIEFQVWSLQISE